MKGLIVGIVLLFSCTDAGNARSTLEAQGFTNIRITGYDAWSCGEGDDTCTGFEAIGPSGRKVRGAVGCGLVGCSKACTVRIRP